MGNTNQGVGYKLGDETIPHDTEEKDLGTIISEDTNPPDKVQQQPIKPWES